MVWCFFALFCSVDRKGLIFPRSQKKSFKRKNYPGAFVSSNRSPPKAPFNNSIRDYNFLLFGEIFRKKFSDIFRRKPTIITALSRHFIKRHGTFAPPSPFFLFSEKFFAFSTFSKRICYNNNRWQKLFKIQGHLQTNKNTFD